jgi:hypothetical protein
MAHSEQFFTVISSFLYVFLQFPVFRDDLDTFAGQCPKKVIIISVKCNLYWCLIEFIDRRYSQSC